LKIFVISHNFLKNNKASTSFQHRGGGPFRVCFADFWVAESACKVAALLLIDRSPVLGILSRPSNNLSSFRFGGNLLWLGVVCQTSSLKVCVIV
jgi:hypothetical protein